jgi:hypothetical protein
LERLGTFLYYLGVSTHISTHDGNIRDEVGFGFMVAFVWIARAGIRENARCKFYEYKCVS